MREERLHVGDEELLLHAGGESRAGSRDKIQAHLECCSHCRARLMELESTLVEFGEAQRKTLEELPPGDGPRAMLKAKLAEIAARESGNGWWRSAGLVFMGRPRAVIFAGVAIAACFLIAIKLQWPSEKWQSMPTTLGHWEEPDLRLTPGATVPVTASEVCGRDAARGVPVVPVSLKRKVFEEYGVTPPQPDAYEVDYLITPELGGATDIRNLWPEPYQDTVWNAHVKDQLEDRLHGMVCRGDLDLATAQRDISTDWIAAYRKYFHADKPVADNSSLNLSSFRRSLPRT
jgi:hypothetical protein